jgi:hypothetical protein
MGFNEDVPPGAEHLFLKNVSRETIEGKAHIRDLFSGKSVR